MASLPSLVLVLVLLVSVADMRLLEFRDKTAILVEEDTILMVLRVGTVALLMMVHSVFLVAAVCRNV